MLFNYHPILMSTGFVLNISLGFWIYNYEDLPGTSVDTRHGRRKWHAICQISGSLFVMLGYAVTAFSHVNSGNALFQVSEFPMGFARGPHWVRAAHVGIGYIALFLLPVQMFVGMLKYRVLEDSDSENDDAYSVHEYIGNTLYFCGLLNVLLGVWLWEGWSLAIRAVITLFVFTSFVFGPRWDGARGFKHEMPTNARHPVSTATVE